MAIRRCPYCKAIIDEGSEYCSNCGTQLLFPEDEYIQEEIPGEKIVEEEAPEEESPEKKNSSSKKKKKKAEQQETEPVEAENEEPQEEEEVGEEVAEEEKDEFFVESQEPAFRTEDLEKAIDSEEKEKAEIEKFLKSLKEDRDEWSGEIPPTDELPPWAEKIKDEKEEEEPAPEELERESEGEMTSEEEEIPEDAKPQEELPEEEPPEADLPPIMREEEIEEKEEVMRPPGLTPEDEVPEVVIPEDKPGEEHEVDEESVETRITEDDEQDLEQEEKTMPDTGMGLPEGVEQENLPFSDNSPGLFEEGRKPPPSKLVTWLKSRAFDVLFIGALWIVALHIASRMLSTNLFKLISVSAFPSVAFYFTLLAVYLFLFFLFLGQTLGDHLFPYEK